MLDSYKRKSYKNLPTIGITELMCYATEIDMGYIRANYHPEDNNIVILNYTELATFERRWNKYTMSARGLILDMTNATYNGRTFVLAMPFQKFFNYGENADYEKNINFDDIEYITEKMDGSLGISYFFKDEIRFATKGSFESEQAIKATELWKKRHASKLSMDGIYQQPVTYLVEIIYPENRVVVDYKGMEELIMLGIINIHKSYQNTEIPYELMKSEAWTLGLTVVPKYDNLTIEQILKQKKELSANREGWIIKFKNCKRLKIKGDEYIEVHRIKHGLSTKAKFKAWSEDRLNEYILALPEEFRDELEHFNDSLNNVLDAFIISLELLYKQIASATDNDIKKFALEVDRQIEKKFHQFMFYAFKNDGLININKLKEHMFKNYREYEEML